MDTTSALMTLIGATSESTTETMLLFAHSTQSATLPAGASGLSVMAMTVAPESCAYCSSFTVRLE